MSCPNGFDRTPNLLQPTSRSEFVAICGNFVRWDAGSIAGQTGLADVCDKLRYSSRRCRRRQECLLRRTPHLRGRSSDPPWLRVRPPNLRQRPPAHRATPRQTQEKRRVRRSTVTLRFDVHRFHTDAKVVTAGNDVLSHTRAPVPDDRATFCKRWVRLAATRIHEQPDRL